MKRAVFLDRDGVINRNLERDGRGYAPVALADFEILPGVPQAVETLRLAGFSIVVATNQPDVGAGKQSLAVLGQMHEILCSHIQVEDIEVCFHQESDNCECRKPKPGMLLRAAKKHGIDLSQSWMVGDRWRDVDAGVAAGCRTVFVDYAYPSERRPTAPDVVVRSLLEAVPFMLRGAP